MIGETKDGQLCMVSIVGFTLYIWFRRASADGVVKWMINNVIQLEGGILRATDTSPDDYGAHKINLWAVLEGIVYFSTVMLRDPDLPCWFLSFCLETRKLEKLFLKALDNDVFPYIMAWPPSLIGDNGPGLSEV